MIDQENKILEPTTEEEAAELLRECSRTGQKVKLVGGGTKLDLGNRYAETQVTLSTRKLDKLIDYQPEDLTVTVGAGMTLARLQEILGEHGQMLPLDPPDLPGQTLGGVLATNRSGPRRLLYGTARDLLIGCRFVLADGSIGHSGGRVVKNVAGYDLHKLFIGSYGTLGLLTEVTFKIVPIPQVIGAGDSSFSSAEAAFQAARQCVRSNLMPAALEVVSDFNSSTYTLHFGAEGVAVAVEGQLAGLSEICVKAGGMSTRKLAEGAATWFKLANLEIAGKFNFCAKVSTTLKDLPNAVRLFEAMGAETKNRYVVQARAGTGVVYLYAELPQSQSQPIISLLEKARAEVRKMEGSLVIERAPLEVKSQLDAWGDFGDAQPSMLALKQKLDPQGLLNPGVMEVG